VENAAPRMGGTFNSFHLEFVDGMNFFLAIFKTME
jgi:hypothetical protein